MRKFILIFSIFLALILAVIIFLPKQDFTLADEVYTTCQDRDGKVTEECITQQVRTLVHANPQETKIILDQLYIGIRQERYDLDGRILSSPSHYAGMALVNTNSLELTEALALCSTIAKQGCTHGVVMQYIENEEIRDEQTLENLCHSFLSQKELYNNCIHAVGHELTALFFDGTNLEQVLAMCDFTDITTNSACISGVLMEYSAWDGHNQLHSHAQVLSNPLECADYPPQYRNICALAYASYSVFYPGQDFSTAVSYCQEQTFAEERQCLLYVAERMIIAAAENAETINNLCTDMDTLNEPDCLELTSEASVLFFQNKSLSWKLWLKSR